MGEQIFRPWVERMQNQGVRFLANKRVSDLVLNEQTGAVSGVVCGDETFDADAVVFSVGISGMQRIVAGRLVLLASGQVHGMLERTF